MLVLFLRWTQRPVQQSTNNDTDALKHCAVRRARFLSEYSPAICTALGIGSCLGLSEFSTQVLDKTTSARGARLLCPLPSTKFLCHLPATLNTWAWNPRLVGRVELGASATPQKSQSCALGLDSQIAGTFFYSVRLSIRNCT
jgi:hypothetical protein